MDINDDVDWYLGTDQKPPASKYNLASICFHELFHGVHMTGFGFDMKKVGDHNEATSLSPNYRNIFDGFITFGTTDHRDCPLYSIKDDPKKLAAALTGGNLWFRTSERRIARLNAPEQFTTSSVYHLNPDYYGEESDLVKPHVHDGVAIHSPGPQVLLILNSLLNLTETPVSMCESSEE